MNLNGIQFEASYRRIIQRLLKRISEDLPGEVSLYVLEKYRDVYKEITVENGLERTGREIRLQFNDDIKTPGPNAITTELVVNYHLKTTKEYKKVLFLEQDGELLGLLTLPADSKLNNSIKNWIAELELTLHYSLARTAEREGHRRLKLVSKLTSVLETETMIEQLIYRSLEIAREMLRVRWIFFLEATDSVHSLRAAIGEGENPLKSMEFQLTPQQRELLNSEALFVSAKKSELASVLFKDELTIGSFIVLSLKIDGSSMGLIVAAAREEVEGEFRPYKHLDGEDLKLLDDVCRRMAVAISKIRLTFKLELEVRKLKQLGKKHEELIDEQKEQLFKLSALHKITQAMKKSLDHKRIVRILLLGTTSKVGLKFDKAVFLKRDLKRRYLTVEASLTRRDEDALTSEAFYGDLARYLQDISFNDTPISTQPRHNYISYPGNTILERVVTRRKIVHVTPELSRFRAEELSLLNEIVQSDEYLIAPVSGEGAVQGIIITDNSLTKRKMSGADIEILGLLADSAGVALELTENYARLVEITESLERERNLSNFYRRYVSSILQSLDSAIVVCSTTGEITEMNRTAEFLLELKRADSIGKHILILKEKLSEIVDLLLDVLRIGETITLSDQHLQALGERYFDVRITPLREGRKNRLEGVIVSMDDVTRRRKLEQDLKAREKLAALGEMSARVAHEIRNPITIIGGFVKRITSTNDQKKISEYAKILMAELQRLDEIVGEALEIPRESHSGQKENFDLLALTRETLDGLSEKAKSEDIELIVECEEGQLEYYANKNRIKQVIINLVQNAIEASDRGSEVRVVLSRDEKDIVFSVWNKGKTIPREILKRIFEPFFTTRTLGTGLGLSICKKIVQEHGGEIEAESGKEGTVFTFRLPIQKTGRFSREENSNSGR